MKGKDKKQGMIEKEQSDDVMTVTEGFRIVNAGKMGKLVEGKPTVKCHADLRLAG